MSSTNQDNLIDDLKEVTEAFNDIKTAIESRGGSVGECTSITEYANIINNLPSGEYSGTFVIFRQSEVRPDTPTGGGWTESGFEYPQGWNLSQQVQYDPNSNLKVWMSYSIIVKGDQNITWSTPVKISGEDGIDSELGVVTLDGIVYWTLNGEFLYDSYGNKIVAQGVNGKDAKSAFTMFVFTRSKSIPNKPIGGNYYDPNPTNTDVTWSTTIPSGSHLPWMSYRIFSSDGKYPQQDEWSNPTYAADTFDLDIAYSTNTSKPSVPIGHWDHSDDDNWTNIAGESTIWMAISKMRNNEWSDWEISKIKGDGGITFELSNDQIIIPVEPDGSIDPDFPDPIITLNLYEGSTLIRSGIIYDSSLSQGIVHSDETATINKQYLSGIDKITFFADYKNNTYSKICNIIRTSNAYELDINCSVITRDSEGKLTKAITVYPKKWTGSAWENYLNCDLNLEYTYISGSSKSETISLNGLPLSFPTNRNDATFCDLTNILVTLNAGGTVVYENIAVVGDGADGKGADGDSGPLIYPAGTWSETKAYTLRLDQVPYVYDSSTGKYYILNYKHLLNYFAEGSTITGDSFAVDSIYQSKPVWNQMESFDSIYADIGVFKEALVGSAVFYKDFMFSQDGYTKPSGSGGQSTSEYWLFNPDDPFGENNSFYPNMCFNLKTGDLWIKRNTFTVQNNTVTLAGWEVTPGGLYVAGDYVEEDSSERFQMWISSVIGLYFGSTYNTLKYAGISSNGSAFFSKGNVRFNNDGSGYLGGTNADTAMISWDPNDGSGSTKLACSNAEIKSDGSGYLGGTSSTNAAISWNQNQVKIGFGEDALIYKLSGGNISNQRNYINCKHYRPDALSTSSVSISNMVGYDHDFFFKSDDSSTFSINFNLTNITNSSDMPSNGYCGTFILSNASNGVRNIKILCKGLGDATSKPACNTISVESKTCQIFKLYYYGFAEWIAIKVS